MFNIFLSSLCFRITATRIFLLPTHADQSVNGLLSWAGIPNSNRFPEIVQLLFDIQSLVSALSDSTFHYRWILLTQSRILYTHKINRDFRVGIFLFVPGTCQKSDPCYVLSSCNWIHVELPTMLPRQEFFDSRRSFVPYPFISKKALGLKTNLGALWHVSAVRRMAGTGIVVVTSFDSLFDAIFVNSRKSRQATPRLEGRLNFLKNETTRKHWMTWLWLTRAWVCACVRVCVHLHGPQLTNELSDWTRKLFETSATGL